MITDGNEFLGIDIIDLTSTDTVNAGANDIFNIQPPEGTCYKILHIYLEVASPGGTSSGTHKFDILQYPSGYQSSVLATLKSNHSDGISIKNGEWSGTSVEAPSDSTEQLLFFYNLWASYDHPISIRYTNNTDVNQTNTIRMTIRVAIYKDVI